MTVRSHYVDCAGYEIHTTIWGSPTREPVFLWHGLVRTGRDFDEIARALSDEFYCICPDLIGRGASQWSRGGADYHLDRYAEIAVALADRLGVGRLRWVGTSLGGLIGMKVAAGGLRDRLTHLVINDVGPAIPEAAIGRIADYVSRPPAVERLSELETYLRKIYAPFGENSDAFWRRLAESSWRRLPDGRITLHYDPAIASQLSAHPADRDLWASFDAIACPILLLRGAESDLLSPALAADMAARHARCRLVEVQGRGHAPTLTFDGEIATVRAFLRQEGP